MSDGEGDADTAGTTVINNYYNNTTEVISEIPEMIALGGFVHGCTGSCHNNTSTINTTAGQMIHIDESRIVCANTCYIVWNTACTNEVNFAVRVALSNSQSYFGSASNSNIPGAAHDCTHTIDIWDATTALQEMSWSLVYNIVPVTVG